MTLKHHGSIDELKALVDHINLAGEWKEETDGKYTFRAKTGEVLTWWPSKGTVLCQGKQAVKLKTALEPMLTGSNMAVPIPSSAAEKRIFVVHGHDHDARDQLELVLMRLGLKPFILQNSDGGGKTIIEALEHFIYKDTSFGIVLLTPDDFGYAKSQGETEKAPRARQNVILEMGMVMAALGRQNMAIIQKGALERPSDTDGILRIEFNDHIKEIVPKLVQSLQGAGFEIEPTAIAAASA